MNLESRETERVRSFGFWFLVGLVLIFFDQAVKFFVASRGAVFKNAAFAFSLPIPVPLIYICYAIILGVIVWYLVRNFRKLTKREYAAWTLILAGSLSNIGERIVFGYVKDFIYLFTGVFNIADFYILVGIAILLLTPRASKAPEASEKL